MLVGNYQEINIRDVLRLVEICAFKWLKHQGGRKPIC